MRRKATSSLASLCSRQFRSTYSDLTIQRPNGNLPSWYSAANVTLLLGPSLRPCMQCAAVMARSACLLCTTAAVQKCRSLPFLTVNKAPTAGVPLNETAVGATEGDCDGDGDDAGDAVNDVAPGLRAWETARASGTTDMTISAPALAVAANSARAHPQSVRDCGMPASYGLPARLRPVLA